MARIARIIGQVEDAWGGLWDVREARSTSQEWPLCLGWPSGAPRGKGGSGGIRAVMTAPLVCYLEEMRDRPGEIDLPCGRTTIKRLRRELGHDWRAEQEGWWLERLEDMDRLTGAQFAARHDVSEARVCQVRVAVLGPRQRPAGWWRDPEIAALLAGPLPRQHIAEVLGISLGAVGRLRWMVRVGL